MKGMGKAMMGTGEAEGEKRAEEATNAALYNPLIDEYSLKGSKRSFTKYYWWFRSYFI